MSNGMQGVAVREVKVISIDDGRATVIDRYNNQTRVRADVRRGNGPTPRVGETWLIDHSLGTWTFAACLRPVLPTVTGDTGGVPAVDALLASLAAQGLIVNATTSTPPEPTVTDHGALTGLADDDHPQYHDDARGDARYYTQATVDGLLATKADADHDHAAAEITSGVFDDARIPTLDLATKTSGTLALGRGGTGATTAAGARAALAATYAGHIGNLSDLDDWDQYPSGYSVGYFSNTAAGRPCSYGTVITNKAMASRTFQMAHAHQSDEVYIRYYYNGSWGDWQRLAQEGQHGIPFAMAAGSVGISLSASAVGSASVSFPAGRFTVAPIVTISQASLPASSGLLIAKHTGLSYAGFTAYAYNGPGTAVTTSATFHWTAVQMTEAGSAG